MAEQRNENQQLELTVLSILKQRANLLESLITDSDEHPRVADEDAFQTAIEKDAEASDKYRALLETGLDRYRVSNGFSDPGLMTDETLSIHLEALVDIANTAVSSAIESIVGNDFVPDETIQGLTNPVFLPAVLGEAITQMISVGNYGTDAEAIDYFEGLVNTDLEGLPEIIGETIPALLGIRSFYLGLLATATARVNSRFPNKIIYLEMLAETGECLFGDDFYRTMNLNPPHGMAGSFPNHAATQPRPQETQTTLGQGNLSDTYEDPYAIQCIKLMDLGYTGLVIKKAVGPVADMGLGQETINQIIRTRNRNYNKMPSEQLDELEGPTTVQTVLSIASSTYLQSTYFMHALSQLPLEDRDDKLLLEPQSIHDKWSPFILPFETSFTAGRSHQMKCYISMLFITLDCFTLALATNDDRYLDLIKMIPTAVSSVGQMTDIQGALKNRSDSDSIAIWNWFMFNVTQDWVRKIAQKLPNHRKAHHILTQLNSFGIRGYGEHWEAIGISEVQASQARQVANLPTLRGWAPRY